MHDPIEEMMIGVLDPWFWWRNALAGKRGPNDGSSPETGFYRVHHKDGNWTPIAYWWEGKELKCDFGRKTDSGVFHKDEEEHLLRAIEKWPFASEHPISEELYRAVYEGGAWPDVDEIVAEHLAENARAKIGGNQPPADEAAQYKIDVENAKAAVERYKEISDDETAARAQSARARLNELAGQGKKKHTELKALILEKGRVIDRKWLHVSQAASAAAQLILAAMTAWENTKFRAEQERVRKEEAERERLVALERLHLAEEQHIADAAIAKGVPPSQMEAPPSPPPESLPPPPPAPVAPPTKIKGGYGRAAGVSTVEIAMVADQDALYAAVKDWQEVKWYFADLAKREHKNNGRVLPGVTTEQARKVS
jgi:hypothetical protein